MSSNPTLSIIIPTQGRETLNYCLQTIGQQRLIPGDEIIVVGDGAQKDTEAAIEAIGEPFRYVQGEHTNDWGHSQINQGMQLAKGDWIAYTDDDDGFLPRAFEAIRARIALGNKAPHLFRFYTNDKHLVWRAMDQGHVSEVLIGGHNLVTPRQVGYMGIGGWTSRYRGDFDWVRAVLDAYPKREWKWCEEILTRQRPERVLSWWEVRSPEQFEALRVLRNECRERMTTMRDEITPAQQKLWASQVSAPDSGVWPFLFSIREESPFAYVGFMLLRKIDGKMWVTYGLGEKYRGKGHARSIMQFALDACMGNAHAEVLETNKASLHLHRELGWYSVENKDGMEYLEHAYPPA